MNALEQQITEFVKNDRDFLVSLRRDFHRHPEIGQEEFRTAARIEEELDRLGLPHKRMAGTGVTAWIDGTGEGPVPLSPAGIPRCLALRADIDALPVTELNESSYQSTIPGRMHACGHDVHMTSLLGTARALAAFRGQFSGRILLIFQPSEENGFGGRRMVEEGSVNGVTRCFGFHIAPELKCGTVAVMEGANNASVDWFRITFRGEGTHAAYPHQGADALYMAAQTITAAQPLVTRLSDPAQPLLLGFGRLEAGTAYNIVADRAVLEGTIRALDPAARLKLIRSLEQLARDTAALYGGTAQIEWDVNGEMLINTAEAVREVRKTAVSLFGEECLAVRKPALIGDDMSDFINAVSGCYAFIGTQDPARPETAHPLHHACLDVDENVFLISVPLTAAYALEYMRGEL